VKIIMVSVVAFLLLFSVLASGVKAQLLSQACDALIARVFNADATPFCTCEPDIKSLSVFVACEAVEKICLVPGSEIICGFPQVEFDFKLRQLLAGKLPFSTSVCYANATIAENPIPSSIPFCIESGQDPLAFLPGGISTDATPTNATEATSGGPCNAKLGGVGCTSCSVCDAATGGVVFNCSNISPTFVSTTCAPLPIGF
jgi:hypothetical protein